MCTQTKMGTRLTLLKLPRKRAAGVVVTLLGPIFPVDHDKHRSVPVAIPYQPNHQVLQVPSVCAWFYRIHVQL